MKRIRRSWIIVAAAVTLVLGTLVPWATGGPQLLANADDNLGQSLLPFGQVVAGVWPIVAALGLVVGLTAIRARPGSGAHRRRRPITLGVAIGAGLALDHSLLMVLGYVPIAIVAAVTGRLDLVSKLVTPALGIQVALAAGVIALLLELRASYPPVTAVRSDDGGEALADARRQTRRWTLIALEAPIAYALTRLLMFLNAPGFATDERLLRMAALGLGLASLGGAVLTWGLIRPWGERFPRWMIGLAGRRVPIDLAVIPGLLVGALVLAAARAILVGMVEAGGTAWDELAESPLVALPHLLWPLWGFALMKAALAYRRRRQLSESTASTDATALQPVP
jgi:hypothetical protein